MKRICRQHGISRWPSRKINTVNRSISKLKRVIESVQGADGAFDLTSLATSPLPVAVGSVYRPTGNGSNQPNSLGFKPSELLGEKIASPTCKTPRSDGQDEIVDQNLGGGILSPRDLNHEQSGFLPESVKGSNKSKTRTGSGEESAGSPTSHGSCQGSPANEITLAKDSLILSSREHCIRMRGGSMDLANQPTGELNLLAAYSIPDTLVATQPLESFGAMLVEDAGSSKDLRNLCPSAADAILEEGVPEFSWTNHPFPDFAPKQAIPIVANTMPNFTARQEMTMVTVKATYREDIIRFRIPLNSGIFELRKEVAKRLNLEVGTFDIKYLDDDHEWVLIVCDADLQECVDISRSSGSNVIRLSIHDIMANLGSSCESTGG